MGRTVRRVPAGFGWPMNKTWEGYLTPDWLREGYCPDCDNGYAPEAEKLHNLWYGYGDTFTPKNPIPADHPGVMAIAQRNIDRSPDFYGTGQNAINREASRLAQLFNSQWSHHLEQQDIDVLIADGRKPKGMTEQMWRDQSIESAMFTDSCDAWIVIRAKCERDGLQYVCATCDGHASVEEWTGQRAAAEAWELFDPPTGAAWQMWENTSEGSPISPAFATADELLDWLVDSRTSIFGHKPGTREQWQEVVGGGIHLHQIAPGVVAI